jgi:uncharacterized protein (TIGR02147 family)
MKPPEIYEFFEYREFLKSRLYRGNRAQRGSLSALAGAVPCQVSYLSRVMSGAADFSAEQAESAARFLGLTSDETFYLLLLVQWARAGTASLKAQWRKRIAVAQEERVNLQKRVGVKSVIGPEDQAVYYSHWYYAAAHVMSGIPLLQTKEAMGRALGLPPSRLAEILKFLVSTGLLREEADGRFVTGVGKIHLRRDSPMILRHHANWRTQAMRSMERNPEQGVHYSVLINTSREDADRLRAMIAQFIEEFMQVVHPSPDEEMSCFALDFFKPEA